MPKQAIKSPKPKLIAFQGALGAYSDIACRTVFPGVETLPCLGFEDAFAAVATGKADYAMIPIENTLAGRVADVHHLMPASGLYIVAEHFQPISHCLLGSKGATLKTLKTVHSHVMALPQCRKIIRDMKLKPIVHDDTAGAAAKVADEQDPTQGAIASELAAQIYGLKILQKNVQDRDGNITRFVVLARKAQIPTKKTDVKTSFIFGVRHIPAALYKALGGFATNGVNITKLESYVGQGFSAAEFYCEVEGHPEDTAMGHAFEELGFYASHINILGTFAKNPMKSSKK